MKKLDIDAIEPCIDPNEDDSSGARKKVIEDFFTNAPAATKADAVRFLSKHYPDLTGGAHRGMLQRMWDKGEEPWNRYTDKLCPKCEEVLAQNNEEAQELFGTRKSGGKIIPQSWCRSCR